MDGEILNQTARATGTSSRFDWPARKSTGLFSNGFWAVALLSVIGLAIALCVSYASPCTGVDLNVGCVPIEMTGQAMP
jgi:hypothetical protein